MCFASDCSAIPCIDSACELIPHFYPRLTAIPRWTLPALRGTDGSPRLGTLVASRDQFLEAGAMSSYAPPPSYRRCSTADTATSVIASPDLGRTPSLWPDGYFAEIGSNSKVHLGRYNCYNDNVSCRCSCIRTQIPYIRSRGALSISCGSSSWHWCRSGYIQSISELSALVTLYL